MLFRPLFEIGFGVFLDLFCPSWAPLLALLGVLCDLRGLFVGLYCVFLLVLFWVRLWHLGCVSCVLSVIIRVAEAGWGFQTGSGNRFAAILGAKKFNGHLKKSFVSIVGKNYVRLLQTFGCLLEVGIGVLWPSRGFFLSCCGPSLGYF